MDLEVIHTYVSFKGLTNVLYSKVQKVSRAIPEVRHAFSRVDPRYGIHSHEVHRAFSRVSTRNGVHSHV
jgi:hypothetical protein